MYEKGLPPWPHELHAWGERRPGLPSRKGSDVNILIVKLSAIGDVIHTLPALNAIRRPRGGRHGFSPGPRGRSRRRRHLANGRDVHVSI